MTSTTITTTTCSVTPVNPHANAEIHTPNLSTITDGYKAIFDGFNPGDTTSTFDELEPALKDRNLAVLNDTTPPLQTHLQNKEEYLCFSEITTFEFANAYPCTIEFEGRCYSNATACFLAQQYIDQPRIMDLLAQCETGHEADRLASQHLMTPESKRSWEKSDIEYTREVEMASFSAVGSLFYGDICHGNVEIPIHKNEAMMRVLRAKFEQNPELKEKLLATGDFYLVCEGNDPCWSNGFNDTGENKLALFLMCLREEYGGTGIVLPGIDYNNMVLELKDRVNSITSDLPRDITYEIFMHCLSGNNGKSIFCLGNTNKHFYKQITSFVQEIDLMLLCPKLTILDAKTLGYTIEGEPSINKFALVKSYYDMAPDVENNEGLTLLTMHIDASFRETVHYAAEAGIAIQFSNDQLEKTLSGYIQASCKCCTYRALITNNVFINSRNKSGCEQWRLLKKMGCEEPNLLEYTHLCIFQKIFNNKCLYAQGTLGRSRSFLPTNFDDDRDQVVIGSFSPTGPLCVSIADDQWQLPMLGTGGVRIIRSKPCNKSTCTIS